MKTSARCPRRLLCVVPSIALALSLCSLSAYADDDASGAEVPEASTEEVVSVNDDEASEAEGDDALGENASPIAETGGVQYTNLEKAFDAVSKGGTITLLADCKSGFINVNTSCTLDLNGHTLSRSGSTAFYPYSFYVQDYIAFTVKDSSASQTGKIYSTGYGIQLEDKGSSLTLESGTIRADRPVNLLDNDGTTFTMNGGTLLVGVKDQYGIYANGKKSSIVMNGGQITFASPTASDIAVYLNNSNCSFTLNGGKAAGQIYVADDGDVVTINGGEAAAVYVKNCKATITMTGGQLTSSLTNSAAGLESVAYSDFYFNGSTGTVSITGGTLSSSQLVFGLASGCKMDISISGGVFESSRFYYDGFPDSGKANFSISGGKFRYEIEEDQCANGYVPTYFSDSTYGVMKRADAAVHVEGAFENFYFASLEDAFGYIASFGGTCKFEVTLLRDYDLNHLEVRTHLWNPGDDNGEFVYLNLNGHTITGTNTDEPLFSVKSKLHISGSGSIVSASDAPLFEATEYGHVFTESGDITYTAPKTIIRAEGANAGLTIRGGVFTVGDDGGVYNTIVCDDEVDTDHKVAISAGRFAHFDPADAPNMPAHTNLCADGYGSVPSGDDFVVEKGAAQVLDSKGVHVAMYSSLQAALDAADDGQTVRVLGDALVKTLSYGSGKQVTLDFYGRTITKSEYEDERAPGLSVKSGALTIVDTSKNSAGGITNLSLYNQAIVLEGTSSVKLVSGSLSAKGYAAIGIRQSDATASFSIEGGSLTGDACAILNEAAGSRVTITGGRLFSSSEWTDLCVEAEDGTVAISGGVFNKEVPAEQCAAGYAPADNLDKSTRAKYPFTVAQEITAPDPEPTPDPQPTPEPQPASGNAGSGASGASGNGFDAANTSSGSIAATGDTTPPVAVPMFAALTSALVAAAALRKIRA